MNKHFSRAKAKIPPRMPDTFNRGDLAAQLRAIVPGDRAVLTSEEDLIAYGYDAAWFAGRAFIVVLPENVEQVAAIHRFAAVDPLGIMNPGKVFPDEGGADAFRLGDET